jgi:hypothetical protein
VETVYIFWLCVLTLALSASGYVLYSSKNLKTLAVAFLLAISWPFLNVTFQCTLSKTSEACVWGKSLLSFYTLISIAGVFPVLFLLLSFCIYVYRKIA